MYYLKKLQIRHKSAVIYDEWQGDRKSAKNRLRIENMKAVQALQYSGNMTTGVKKRLTKAINLLVMSAKPIYIYNPVTDKSHYHRLSFLTLTIPDKEPILSPKEGYRRLLTPFLQWLRRTEKVKTYIWKSEYQKRGQLHYHITTPSFIHYQSIKDKWNNIIRAEGLMKDYTAEYGSIDPNSTDINEVKHITNLASYLAKEFCKSIQNPTNQTGKLWDCSENLSKAKYMTIDLTNRHQAIIDKLLQQQQATDYTGNFFSFIKFKSSLTKALLNDDEKALLQELLNNIRNSKN